jgi:polar amino acid transport system substrate-binding protein
MKKLVFLSLLACALFFSCSKGSGADNSLEKVQDAGVFVLGLDDSFPPMGFRDENNEIVGFDIDLAKEVAGRLGVELKTQPIDWASKEQELATGNIDCIWNGFTITPERQKALLFSAPYLNNAQVVVVRADSQISSIENLAGKRVALQAGSTALNALNENSELKSSLSEVVELRDNLTAFMELNQRTVDAVILDEVVARYNISKSDYPFVVLSDKLASEEYAIGFRKKDVQLRDAVQNELNNMLGDGTMTKITAKWFGGQN